MVTPPSSADALLSSATLLAREAIAARINRLCLDLDTGDLERARAAFTPGAICRHGDFAGSAQDYVDAAIAHTLPGVSPWGWQLTTHRSRAEGRSAWAETYAIATAGNDASVLCGLRLLDALDWLDGEWLIASRETILDWSFGWPEAQNRAGAPTNGGLG